MEEWKEIVCNQKTIYVSNSGNIRRSPDGENVRWRYDKDGYPYVRVGKKSFLIHRLVAKLFVCNPDNKPEVNHLDFNRKNPKYDNLEWCTRKENIAWSKEHHKEAFSDLSGESNPNAKLTEDDIRKIRKELDDGESVSDIARRYGRGWQTINHIKHRSTWKNVE